MNTPSLLSDGITLMIFGVTFVFIFLTLLVMITSIMSWIIIKYEERMDSLTERESREHIQTNICQDNKNENAPDADGPLISILSTAIHKYRHSHHKK